MVKKYRKGYMGEREMVHLLYNKGYMAIRTPRSGRICLPSPDVIAAKNGRLIVIECKSREDAFKISEEQLKELEEWQIKACAEAYIAWKISRKGWSLLKLEDVMNNKGNVNKSLLEKFSFSIDSL